MIDIYEYPDGTVFKCSLGVRVKTIGVMLYCNYRSIKKRDWEHCANDINYAKAIYTKYYNWKTTR